MLISKYERVTPAGVQGIEPRPRRCWKPPGYRCLTPPVSIQLCSGPKNKRAASRWRRLLNGLQTCKFPGHTIRSTSVSSICASVDCPNRVTSFTGMAARVARGPTGPSRCRFIRPQVASMYRIASSIHIRIRNERAFAAIFSMNGTLLSSWVSIAPGGHRRLHVGLHSALRNDAPLLGLQHIRVAVSTFAWPAAPSRSGVMIRTNETRTAPTPGLFVPERARGRTCLALPGVGRRDGRGERGTSWN